MNGTQTPSASKPTNCVGIAAWSKSGKRVAPEARSARTFAVLVTDADGKEWAGERDADMLGRVVQAATVLREVGLPSTWDADVLGWYYTAI